MRIAPLLLALASAGCSQIAAASTITEFSRTAFQAALSSAMLSSQDFDSLPVGTIVTVNGVTYTPSLGAAFVTGSFLTSTPPNGLGSDSIGLGFLGADETLTIVFSSPVTAFALDINTFASNSGDYSATVNDGSNSVVPSLLDVFPNTETGQFIGFTDSSPFTSIVISPVSDPGTGNGNCGALPTCSYTVDTLVYGDAAALVPEPSVWAMMLTGFAGLGAVALGRRRKIIHA